MIFTSYLYVVFLVAAFILHWSVPVSWRKPFIVAASYVFYCSWQWQYGFLLLAVTLFNFSYARWVLARYRTPVMLVIGIGANVALLTYFKYTRFLLENLVAIFDAGGAGWNPSIPEIILPLGISFFTFQGVAYLVDVATGEEPIESLLDFMVFKTFWSQLIAGPIVRLHELRDQLATPRELRYENVAEGARRILMGMAKKVVVADVIGSYVESAFRVGAAPNFLDAAAGTLGFAIQIYMDFSAYTDIAVGSAMLFGYRFPENFNEPYAARSPQEFWTRWHMTLSRWIRDYLFTPAAFATRDRPGLAPLWLLLAMTICGLWHGAQWTFVLWGVWHGALLAVQMATGSRIFPRVGARISPLRSVVAWALTFALVCLGWVLFRAPSLPQALDMYEAIFTFRGGLRPSLMRESGVLLIAVVFVGMLLFQQLRRWRGLRTWFEAESALSRRVLRPAVYAILLLAIVVADQEATPFMYFQF